MGGEKKRWRWRGVWVTSNIESSFLFWAPNLEYEAILNNN
jgi:hypothetical protein